MASSLALKRLLSSNLIPSSLRLIRPASAVQPGSRFFNTNALRQVDDRRGDEFVSDVNPPSRSVTVMDQLMDDPFAAASGGFGGGVRRSWDARETENLRIDMPGLDKKDVKMAVEQNTLMVKGEGEKESEEEESRRRYGVLFSSKDGSGLDEEQVKKPKKSTTKIRIVVQSFDFDEPFFENLWGRLPPYTRKIGLPDSRVLYTVLRSPHIDKKSREQFKMEIKKKILVIETKTHELSKKFFWLKRQRLFGAQHEILFCCKTRLDKGKLQRLF